MTTRTLHSNPHANSSWFSGLARVPWYVHVHVRVHVARAARIVARRTWYRSTFHVSRLTPSHRNETLHVRSRQLSRNHAPHRGRQAASSFSFLLFSSSSLLRSCAQACLSRLHLQCNRAQFCAEARSADSSEFFVSFVVKTKPSGCEFDSDCDCDPDTDPDCDSEPDTDTVKPARARQYLTPHAFPSPDPSDDLWKIRSDHGAKDIAGRFQVDIKRVEGVGVDHALVLGKEHAALGHGLRNQVIVEGFARREEDPVFRTELLVHVGAVAAHVGKHGPECPVHGLAGEKDRGHPR